MNIWITVNGEKVPVDEAEARRLLDELSEKIIRAERLKYRDNTSAWLHEGDKTGTAVPPRFPTMYYKR